MRIFIYYGLRISILFYVFLHILTFFIENTVLLEMIHLLLLFSNQDINVLRSGMTEMRIVLGLLVVIPLISSALQEEHYIVNLIGVFNDFIITSNKFYFTLV